MVKQLETEVLAFVSMFYHDVQFSDFLVKPGQDLLQSRFIFPFQFIKNCEIFVRIVFSRLVYS